MYLTVLIILSCIALIEVFNSEIIEKYKAVFVFGVFCLFVFHDGFRWETGCDWDAYHFFFEFFFQETQKEGSLTSFEPGYVLFVGAIRSLTDEYSVYLIAHAILFYTFVFYGIFKCSKMPFTSLMILYMVIVPYMGTNRQLLAVGFYLTGLYLLSNNYKWWYLGIIILASLFHRTALIGLLAYFLGRKINKWVFISVISICLIIKIGRAHV